VAETTGYTHDVFLSYNQAQLDWAEILARRLCDAGVRVWFDKWSLRPGAAEAVTTNPTTGNWQPATDNCLLSTSCPSPT